MSDIRDYIRKRVLEINEENRKKQLEEQERKNSVNNFRNSVNQRQTNNKKDIEDLKNKRTEILANSSNTLKKQTYVEPQKNLFEQVIDTARKNLTNDIGNIVSNIVTGIPMGINDFSQNINNQMYNTMTDRSKLTDKMRQDGLEIMMKNAKTDEEKQKIQDAMNNNNYLGSTTNLQNELKEINLKYDSKNNEYLEQINKNIDEITNPVMKRIAEVAPSVGQMVPAFLSGGTGLVYSTGSAKQSYLREAKQRGMGDDEANLYSGFMSIAEGLSDKLAIDRIGKTTGDFIKGSKALNNLKNIGINIGNNYIQEAIMRPISELVAKFTAGDEFLQYDFRTADGWNNLLKDMNNDGLNGAIMGGMLQLGTMGLTAPARIYNKMKEGKNVSNSEIKLALNEARNNGIDVDKIMADNIRQNIEQNFQNNNIQENNLPESNIKQGNKQEQQIISNKNKNENMTNSALNRASISEQEQNTLIESAKKYNLNGNSEDIKGINEGLDKRNISSKFDDSFFKDNQGNIDTNTNAIWRTSKDEQGNIKREVIFNPNADTNKTIQQVAVHELWHDMVGSKEGKELADLILNRNSKQEGYKEARTNLEDIYSKVYDRNSKEFKNLVDEEEVADTLAQKLGDQDFINSLNKDNPTVFKKIYDWIVDKLNKFTGGRNEKLYWENVKNKFEKVYKQKYNGNGKSKFSIQKDNNGNEYVKIDTDQNIFEGKAPKEYAKIARDYILKNFRDGEKKIKLPTKENIKVIRRTANEYTYPKNKLSKDTRNSKMKASTELDNLISISQYQYSRPDDGRHDFAKDGWDYYKTIFEVDGKRFEGLVNIGKNGKEKTLYDITNIKEMSHISYGKNLPESLSTSPSIKNSISTSKDNVNTTDNNSMQNNVNNTQNTKYSINDNKKDNIKYDEDTEEVTYKGKPIYFRFDDKGGFKGKDHKSGVSMWEDRVDEMLFPDYDSYDDVDIAEQKIDNILEPYGLTYEEYDSMQYEKQLEIKREIAEDEGLITNGASVFNFANWGLDWFKEYDDSHGETDYPEVNFFTGEVTGEGADGEDVVIPDEIIATMDTKELMNIIEDVEWDDTLENATGEEKNREILKRVSEYINLKNNEANTKSSKQNEGAWDRFLKEHVGSNRKGKTIKGMRLPTKEDIQRMDRVKSENAYTVLYDKPLVPNEDGKFRKHYKSIMNSPNLPEETKKIAREFLGSDTYVPDSNERQLKEADRRINADGADGTARTFANKLNNGDKITAEDIATGERLIQYYSKTGEWEKLQDVIQNVAMAGTEAGQTVQAFSLIRKQTPTGQAIYMRKLVDKLNKEIDKQTHGKGKKFELNDDMIQKILNSDKENLENAIDEVTRELGQQVPKRAIEKLDSWRYFSMLFNPRTHIRNIIGNFAMGKIQGVKNKVGAGLEAVAQKTGIIKERTKAIKPASKETKQFAKSDFDNVKERITNEDKFDSRSLIRKYQRTFKSDVFEKTLGKMFNLNSNLLEKEDIWGSRKAYTKAMADYMTANKLTPEYINSGTKEANVSLEKARKYAVEQAQEATFRTKSSLASLLNTLEDKNIVSKLIVGGVIPFKKTPINIAITGLNYSPIGIVKSFTTNLVKLNRGDITVNKYIDDLAKGLTGTGIATVGMALAQAGILLASGDDNEKKQYYDEDRGTQTYAITIGDKTFSLDWAAPAVIPLFLGAGIYDGLIKPQEDNNGGTGSELEALGKVLDSSVNSLNPLVDMSMLSGVSSAIKTFSQNPIDTIGSFLMNSGKSYVNQFVPTLSRQIAKTVDDTERSTTSTEKNGFARTVDSLVKSTISSIPGVSKTLPAKTDVWGNVNKRSPNVFERFLEQSILPWNSKTLKSTEVDKAVLDLYDTTGESSALPKTSIEKEFTVNGEKYRLTNKEYADYRKDYGKNSYNLLKELVTSNEYRNMNDEQKLKAVSSVYSYANENNKLDYAKKNNIDVESSSMYNAVKSIERNGGNAGDYFKYVGQTTGMEKDNDKLNVLINSNMSTKSKSAIYSNTIGSDDDNYNLFYSKTGMNINEYLKYKKESSKTGSLVSDIGEDGKAINNSKKEKVYAYVNNMNITYQQKLALLGIPYKLESDELNDLIQYIFDTISDSNERISILDKYKSKQGFKIENDGTIIFE